MTKIALFADVHGNVTAFNAVITAIKKAKVDDVWCLGDLLLPGPGAEELFATLEKESISTYLKGNWEDCFLDVLAGNLDVNDASDLYLAALTLHILPTLSTQTLEKIKTLPMTLAKKINGITFGLSHALPQKNYGGDLFPTQPQENFDALFNDREIDVAITAHTHQQFVRQSSQGQLIINPGSVGQPFNHWPTFAKDFRAQFAIIEVDAQGVKDIQLKKVAYDIAQEITRAKNTQLPFADFYETYFKTGETFTHNAEKIKAHPHYADYLNEVKKFLAARK